MQRNVMEVPTKLDFSFFQWTAKYEIWRHFFLVSDIFGGMNFGKNPSSNRAEQTQIVSASDHYSVRTLQNSNSTVSSFR